MASVQSQVNDVRNTFSSWDSCMSKTYCKWPVIAGIIVGSLILISVLWCVASCLCCGATLCGSCVRCLTCFGCCGACGRRGGGGGGGGRTRHKDDYTQMPPTPYNGYQAQPTPMTYQPPASTPQFAQFDSSKKIHEDSLPAMPSWDSARERRVEDHSEPLTTYRGQDVEMGRLDAPRQTTQTRRGYNQVPVGPVSPLSPPVNYGHFENQAQSYSSDLGAQRLGPQQTGYSDFDPSPLSPAPTYRTNAASVAPATHTDRFAPAPMAHDYDDHSHLDASRNHTWSPPLTTHHEPTSYQSYGARSLSPPHSYQPTHVGYDTQDQEGYRPPSLLQVGRKPVMGSQREI